MENNVLSFTCRGKHCHNKRCTKYKTELCERCFIFTLRCILKSLGQFYSENILDQALAGKPAPDAVRAATIRKAAGIARKQYNQVIAVKGPEEL